MDNRKAIDAAAAEYSMTKWSPGHIEEAVAHQKGFEKGALWQRERDAVMVEQFIEQDRLPTLRDLVRYIREELETDLPTETVARGEPKGD